MLKKKTERFDNSKVLKRFDKTSLTTNADSSRKFYEKHALWILIIDLNNNKWAETKITATFMLMFAHAAFRQNFFFSYKRNHWEKELKVDFWCDYRKMKNIYIKAIEHATQWVNLEWTSRGCINRGTNVFFSKESCHTIQISSSEFNYFIYQPMLRMEFYQKRKIGLSFNGPQYRWAGIVLDLTKNFSATFSFKGKSNCVSVKWRNMIQISQKKNIYFGRYKWK